MGNETGSCLIPSNENCRIQIRVRAERHDHLVFGGSRAIPTRPDSHSHAPSPCQLCRAYVYLFRMLFSPSDRSTSNEIYAQSFYRKSFSNWLRLLNTSDLFGNKLTRRWSDMDGLKRGSAKCTRLTVSYVKFPGCKDSVLVSYTFLSIETIYLFFVL